MRKITNEALDEFRTRLLEEERATATVDKYMRDMGMFARWLQDRSVDKGTVLAYKAHLIDSYCAVSVNSILSALNAFFRCMDWQELRVKTLKIQRRTFASEERELTKEEYGRLLGTARACNNERLYLLMQTVCATGIRISELKSITVESVARRRVDISCKGKCRTVFLPERLCLALARYIKKQKITSGSVFVSKNGKPLDRSNIWSDMKKLCQSAGVSEEKVFPHNLRHLFARTYYALQKDIVRLADILGHSSVNTTRIYTMESGEIHRRQIEKLGLLRC